MNLARPEASGTFLIILAVPSKQVFFNIGKRWLIALANSLDLIFKFLILFHLLLFSHRPRYQMGMRYLSMSILVGCYSTQQYPAWRVPGVCLDFEVPKDLHLLTFKYLFDFVTVRCSSWIYSRTPPLPSYHASSSYIFSALVSFISKQCGEPSPLFRHTFCNYCQYPPCLQPSWCFSFLLPVLAPPLSHLPFLCDPLLFNHSQDLFLPISSVAVTILL